MANFILPCVALTVVVVLFRPALRGSPMWRATVTPLASIIGSGFLVSGPLLSHIAGKWAPLAMMGILLVAFAIGSVIRFSITYVEPYLAVSRRSYAIVSLQRLSDLALGFAYVVSVAFYVRLLASFVLRFGGSHDDVIENMLTTVVLLFIAVVGWIQGLGGLEKMEEAAVVVKLAIIAALLVGLCGFDWYWLESKDSFVNPQVDMPLFDRLRLLAGLLLIVQGFETSRYLGDTYDAKTRVRSMRHAQLIASGIYLLFVILGLPLLMEFHGNADETAIISLAGRVATILPALLVLAAVMSQFSAAVADTLGAGGLFSELSGRKLSPRIGYVGLTIAAIVLVWAQNVFEIITLASRLFAFYYLLQCLLALAVSVSTSNSAKVACLPANMVFSVLALMLAAVILFAIPVA